MKSRFVNAVLLTASVLGAFRTASAETLHARIPFAFSVAGTAMPAGSYTIRALPDTPNILVFENDEMMGRRMFFARADTARAVKMPPPLTFVGSEKQMGLIHIATGTTTYELSSFPVRNALKGAELTLASGK